MKNSKRKYTSSYDFDTLSDLQTEGIVHPDDAAAMAGLRMQREEEFEQSEEEFQEWLKANQPQPAAESGEDEF